MGRAASSWLRYKMAAHACVSTASPPCILLHCYTYRPALFQNKHDACSLLKQVISSSIYMTSDLF
uniref:Uncharacterized protein n=1 Tax=Zea mays TaxID=4577 RepID=B6UFS1_MAIZE|nr:hypothetical protein [Zea mays]